MELQKLTYGFAAFMLLGSELYATNGDQLIGSGAASRAMGGLSVATPLGAESAAANPALIGYAQTDAQSFALTAFMPRVATDLGSGEKRSDVTFSAIPSITTVSRSDLGVTWGVAFYGTAGMGVDYRDESSHMNMTTNLQLMKFALPVAYGIDGFVFGAAPVLQYGALDIGYAGASTAGVAQDYAAGYQLGFTYRKGNWTVGMLYRSAIDMTYKGQLSRATADFGLTGFDDHLEQPAETGFGVSYQNAEHTVGAEWRRIEWAATKGYGDFGWENQTVVALGYAYRTGAYVLRVGYNHAESPIQEQNPAVNVMNLLGFPATVESHYTLGGSIDVSNALSVELTYVQSAEASTRYMGMGADVSTVHTQRGITLGVVFR